ncbi:MAG: FAD-dependent oxidoreductase [Candidatus Diapherotrites archaeon]|nr:FAD-dependent oxidoreductase [Candidatus Diapherotrites archaeon]
MVKFVILGLGSGGFAALMAARKVDPACEIVIVDDKEFDLLHNCGLPYVLDHQIPSFDNLRHTLELNRLKAEMMRGKALHVDSVNKKIIVQSGTEQKEVSFDSLLISTGARAMIPPIPGVREHLNQSVFVVHSIESTKALQEKSLHAKKAVVVGAGAIGLETAAALCENGLEVSVVEMASSVFPRALDEEIAKLVEEQLKTKGIELFLGKRVEEVSARGVRFENQWIEADLVVLAAGITPNTDFLNGSGIELQKGFVPVNEFLQTTVSGIYAVGDVALVNHVVTQKPIPTGLATTAYLQGQIAGHNAVIAEKKRYSGTTATFVSVLGEIELASTGLTRHQAQEAGFSVVEAQVKGKNRPEWFGSADELVIKLLVDSKTRQLIGCQTVGRNGYVRVNVVSTGLRKHMDIYELMETEMAYCPPVADTYDLLLTCAGIVVRKIELLEKGRRN